MVKKYKPQAVYPVFGFEVDPFSTAAYLFLKPFFIFYRIDFLTTLFMRSMEMDKLDEKNLHRNKKRRITVYVIAEKLL